jgi:GNAT superfamily N-acetyltransferase
VGTGRLVLETAPPSVGRIAVAPHERGTGVGAAVLARLEERAAERGIPELELHAQVHARGFYDRAGWSPVGEVYLEAGIEHLSMRKALPVLREVRDEDGPALIELIGGCWREYPGVELHVDAEEPWLRAPATAYRGWEGRMWVAELAADLVACCGVRPAGGDVVELKSMYVAARARRLGLARRLEALVLGEANARGASRVELWSDTRFLDAHAAYRALGYEQLPGERDLHDLSHSREYPFVKGL